MAEKVGDVYVQLSIDSKKFKAGLSTAKEGLKTFGMNAAKGLAMVTAAATTLTVALTKITKDTVRYGVETDRLVKLLGLTGEQVTKLGYALEQEHGSMEKFEKGLFNLTVRLGYAGDELETYIRYFDALNVAYKNADGTLRNTYDVFLDLVDVTSKGVLSTEKMAAVAQLFGSRVAKELIPFMKLGRDEIERLGEEAEALGRVMSTKTAAAMKKVDDSITALQGSLKGFRNLIGERIAPAVQGFTETMVDAFIKIRKHIDDLLPSLANLGEDTDEVANIGVEFAKKTVTAIFTVMNIWTRLETVYWSVRSAFNRLMQFHNKQYELLFEFTTFWLRKVAEVWDKVFKTDVVASLDTVSEGFNKFNKIVGDEAVDNMDKARQSAYNLERSYKTQMEILNNLSPMTLHFSNRTKGLGDESEEAKEKIAGLIENEKTLGEEIIKTRDELIENMKLPEIFPSEDLSKIITYLDEFGNRITLVIGQSGELVDTFIKGKKETKDWSEQTEALGGIIGSVAKKGKVDMGSLFKSLLGVGMSFIPGGGFLKGLLGGFGFGEGGMHIPRAAEGLMTVPAVSPAGVIYNENTKTTPETILTASELRELIYGVSHPTNVIHNANPDTYVETFVNISESVKYKLARFLSDEVLNKTEELNA